MTEPQTYQEILNQLNVKGSVNLRPSSTTEEKMVLERISFKLTQLNKLAVLVEKELNLVWKKYYKGSSFDNKYLGKATDLIVGIAGIGLNDYSRARNMFLQDNLAIRFKKVQKQITQSITVLESEKVRIKSFSYPERKRKFAQEKTKPRRKSYVSANGKVNYQAYILSDDWRVKANEAKRLANHRCQVCNKHRSQITLDAHHRTYERLGREQMGDLTVLCRDCHELYERNKRRKKGKR